jgi:sugar lactone lactonase YvrE
MDGPSTLASFNYPVDIAADSSGNLYVTDASNHTIRKILPDGTVSTLAGNPGVIGSADGTGSGAMFNLPTGLTVDSAGNVYVVDTGSHTIRKIKPDGTVTTIAGSPGIAGSADDIGSKARFNTPASIVVDSHGNLFVTDRLNDTIRKIATDGTVSTFAGTAGTNGSADGTGKAATFTFPLGLAIDSSDNLYVGDGMETIRKITPDGVVTTMAGTAGVVGSADDTGTAASFYGIAGMTADASGNVYLTDQGNNSVRKITPAGVVSTIAGTTGNSLWTNTNVNGAANAGAVTFNSPTGVAVDPSGNIYVADYNNQIIRKIVP